MLKALFQSSRHSIQVDLGWTIFQFLCLRFFLEIAHVALFDWSYEMTTELGDNSLGRILSLRGPPWIEALGATILTMLAIDLVGYGLHRAMHQMPFLWRIHQWHHSATFLTPLTTFRQHPLEPLLLKGARGMAAGLALGLMHAVFPQCTPVWTFGGMGVGYFLYMFTVNLHHAPIPIQYPKVLSSWLISPHIHHLHHSSDERHHGKNFGIVFSVWDRLFVSYLDQPLRCGELAFGLKKAQAVAQE